MATYHLSAKVGSKGMGRAHSDYIDRVGKNAKKKDLEHAENGNLPDWANGKASAFWSAADDQERENGSVYRELEIALPRELIPAQRLELVREFISQEIGEKHAYSFAIHCPKAALDPAKGEQPHAHIMYSERLQDGIDRPKEQYFKRYNSKNPEKGGLKKAIPKDMVEKKQQLRDQRERWANLQNQHLARHGHTATVDHRNLEAQGIERDPSKHLPHLGVSAISIMQKRQPSTRINMLNERHKALRTEHDKRKAPPPVVEKAKEPPKMVSRYDPRHPSYVKVTVTENKPEPQPKPNPSPSQPTDSELLRALQARYAILREHKSLRMANSYQMEIAQKKEAGIRAERKQLEQRHAALGARPLMFGKAEWDTEKKYLDNRDLSSYNELVSVTGRIKEITEAADPDKSIEAAIKLVRAEGFTKAEIDLALDKRSMEKAEIIRAQQERTVKQAKEAIETQQKAAEAIKTTETVKYTAEMQKTLTERLRASMEAFIQWIKDKGGIRKEINTENSSHSGKITAMDDLHAVQHLGRGTYAIHRLDRLDEVPKLDVSADIKYRDGRGVVAVEKVRDRGMSM